MTAYKLVTVQFKWWGLQDRVENFIHTTEKRLFTNFHRQVINIVRMAEIIMTVQVFCWMDKWHGMTMEDIRALEEETKNKLDQERSKVNTIFHWLNYIFPQFFLTANIHFIRSSTISYVKSSQYF